MKFLLPLIALLFSFNTFSQTIELMDTTKMKKLKPGSYEYVMMGSKEEIVIEKRVMFSLTLHKLMFRIKWIQWLSLWGMIRFGQKK